LDQKIVKKVQQKWLYYYRSYLVLRTTADLVLAPPPFPVDDDGIYHPEDEHCYIIRNTSLIDEIPDTILEFLRACRFDLSRELVPMFETLLSSGRSLKDFLFFFERINFVPGKTDETVTVILNMAFEYKRLDGADAMLYHDFEIVDGYRFFTFMENLNVEELQHLLLGHPKKAISLSPTRRSLRKCNNAKMAHRLIDLASKINPAGFDLSDFLRGLVKNHNIEDAAMAEVIEHLCKMGAVVTKRTCRLLKHSHEDEDYAKSRETLQFYKESQKDDIKEPEMD
jgi:hypothetical protein